jgi:hypothetical protein
MFNLRTLLWESAYPPTPCDQMTPANLDAVNGRWISTGHPSSRQTYDMLVMDERRREMLLLNYNPSGDMCGTSTYEEQGRVMGRVAHYDPERRSWRFSPAAANAWDGEGAAEFDPVSGLTVVVSGRGLWTYDPAPGVITPAVTWSEARMHYSAQMVYFPPNQRFYYFTRTGLVFEISPDRARWEGSAVVELTGISGSAPPVEAKGWAYDPERQVLAGGVRDGVFHALDPVARRWDSEVMAARSDAGAKIGNPPFFSLIYDPVDGVFVFTTDYEGGWRTWAYRR